MTPLPWYKCNPRDFNDGMMGMPPEERGVYVTVLNLIYLRGGPIQDDPAWIAGWCCCSVKTWRKVRASLIVKGKLFEVNHNALPCLMNRRAAEEIAARDELIGMRSEAGAKGGRKTSPTANENNDIAQASAKQELSKSQAIETVDVRGKDASASLSPEGDASRPRQYPPLFEDLWKAYPHIRGRSSKPKSLGIWRRLGDPIQKALPLAATRYGREGREPKADCGAPALERWLRDAKYEDWMTAAPAARPAALPVTPEVLAYRLRHYRQTREWKDGWGARPEDPERKAG